MFERLSRGEPAIGTITLTSSPEWVEIMGHTGLDFGVIDLMITSVGWDAAANLIRAAALHNMTPWIRLEAFPWGQSDVDGRTPADVLRALSIGAEVVLVPLSSPEQAAAALAPASSWHRRAYLNRAEMGNEELKALRQRLLQQTMVVPLIASRAGADNLERIAQVPQMRAIFLHMGDLSRELGHAGDPTHPDMRAFVDHAVQLGRTSNLVVMANTGHFDTPEAITDVVAWLWASGVSVIWIPYFEYIVQRFFGRTLQLIRGSVEPRREPMPG